MRVAAIAALLIATATGAQVASPPPRPGSATEAMYQASAASAERKIQHIQQNAERASPDQTPTVLTEPEVNAYLASGQVKLPKGVKSLHLAGTPGVIEADARVDFDAITAGSRTANPLMKLFSGTHQVNVNAHASGSGGQGRVHVDSAAIDGIGVPTIALQYFADHYVKPKYPNLGIDSVFKLPERIDTATVGSHQVTVTQK